MANKVQKFVRYQVDGVDSVLFGAWFGWFLLYERTQQVEALSAPPHVQFSAIIICAFIPSAEFCSYNSFKTSPAKSSVGMFLYALFFRPMKVLSPFIMNASDIFSVGCFQLEFFYFKPKFFKHFKIFLVGASFDCKKVSADEGVGSA